MFLLNYPVHQKSKNLFIDDTVSTHAAMPEKASTTCSTSTNTGLETRSQAPGSDIRLGGYPPIAVGISILARKDRRSVTYHEL
jgi:hypothetical protein